MPRLLAACCLLLAAVTASAVERIPADSRWVVSIDVPAVVAGQVGGWVKAQLARQQTAAQLRILEAVSGFNIARDLRHITLCGAEGGDATGLLLLRGVFDAGKLTALAEAADEHALVQVGSRTIHTWKDKGKPVAGCLAAADLLIIGRTAERITQALKAIDDSVAPPVAIPAGWEGAAMVVAAADGLDGLADKGPQSALFKNFRGLAARISETGDMLVLDAEATATGEAQAQQVVDAGNGLRALVQLQKPEDLDAALADAVRTAQLGRTGTKVTLHLTLPVADAKRLAEKQQQKKGG